MKGLFGTAIPQNQMSSEKSRIPFNPRFIGHPYPPKEVISDVDDEGE